MNIVKRRGHVDLSSTEIRKPQTIEPQTRNKYNNMYMVPNYIILLCVYDERKELLYF